MGKLKGRVAIVTGAGRGIGHGIASAFVREGASVVLADSDADLVDAAARALRHSGGEATHARTDVTDQEAVLRLVETAIETYGRLEVLVNNAGICSGGNVASLALSEWQRMLDIDLTSVFLCSQAALPATRTNRWGRIINIGSQLATKGAVNRAHYCAAKAGVAGFTRALALEVARENITVNVIAPGPVDTPMLRADPESALIRQRDALPVGRFGRVEEIAAVAILLASDEGAFFTGSTINVSGGDVL